MPAKITSKLKLKKFWFLFFIFTFYILHFCYAAPCYGTKMPRQKQFFVGGQNYNIFKRHLKDNYGKMRSTQYFFLLSYGVFDWLSIDLKGGQGNIKQHPVDSDEIHYPTYMGGGYGFRLRLYEKNGIKAVFGFQHISIHPQSIYVGSTKHKAVLDDWQLSALVSYSFKRITPYLGTRWSRCDYIHWVNTERKLEKSDLTKSYGLIVGFDLPLTQKIWLNAEGQFFDSEAVAFSLNYGF